MLELILPAALAGTGLLWGRHGFKRRRRLQVWRQAAASCGLEMEESAGIWGSRRLDVEMRRLLARASPKCEISIVDGELRADLTEAQIRGFVPFLLDLSRRLAQPLDIGERLAHNARRDPEARVRLQNLLLLIHELPKDPKTAATLHEAGQLSLAVDPAGQLSISGGEEPS